MAKCYITCDVGADQSLVDAIKTSLAKEGHEVVNYDISNDEDGCHIEVGRDDIIVKKAGTRASLTVPSNRIKMADGLYLTREDEEPIEERIERFCEKLNKILL